MADEEKSSTLVWRQEGVDYPISDDDRQVIINALLFVHLMQNQR